MIVEIYRRYTNIWYIWGGDLQSYEKKYERSKFFFRIKSLVARSAERSEGTRARRDLISAPLPRSAEQSEALRGNWKITTTMRS